jgi:hypothetical protein
MAHQSLVKVFLFLQPWLPDSLRHAEKASVHQALAPKILACAGSFVSLKNESKNHRHTKKSGA